MDPLRWRRYRDSRRVFSAERAQSDDDGAAHTGHERSNHDRTEIQRIPTHADTEIGMTFHRLNRNNDNTLDAGEFPAGWKTYWR